MSNRAFGISALCQGAGRAGFGATRTPLAEIGEVEFGLNAYLRAIFLSHADDVSVGSRLDDRYPAERVVNFMANETRHWLSSAGAPTTQRRTGTIVSLVCRDGERFDLTNVRYNGEPTLGATLGQAEIDLDPSRLVSLVVIESGERCLAHLTATDGTKIQVCIDGSVVVSGDTPVGTIRVAIRDVSSLTRR